MCFFMHTHGSPKYNEQDDTSGRSLSGFWFRKIGYRYRMLVSTEAWKHMEVLKQAGANVLQLPEQYQVSKVSSLPSVKNMFSCSMLQPGEWGKTYLCTSWELVVEWQVCLLPCQITFICWPPLPTDILIPHRAGGVGERPTVCSVNN